MHLIIHYERRTHCARCGVEGWRLLLPCRPARSA